MNRRIWIPAVACALGTAFAPSAWAQGPSSGSGMAACCGSEASGPSGGMPCCERHKGRAHGDKDECKASRPELESQANFRFLSAPATIVHGHGMRWRHPNGLAMGCEGNLGLELFPTAGAGHWLSGFGGVAPGYQAKVGELKLGAEALLGLGWMVRSTAPAEVLQGRVMWVAEPRLTIGYQADHWGVGLTGGYLFSPVPNDLGGISIGVSLTGRGRGGHGKHGHGGNGAYGGNGPCGRCGHQGEHRDQDGDSDED